jgi:hypothetical protein
MTIGQSARKFAAAALLMLAGLPAPGHAESEGKAGATLDKPVSLSVSGGYCESDGNGSVGANFGDALAFNIGPRTVGMPSMNHAPFAGPGTYQHVIITGYPAKGVAFGGLGSVTVNPDRRSGTFRTDDGKASGSWDCGTPLQ